MIRERVRFWLGEKLLHIAFRVLGTDGLPKPTPDVKDETDVDEAPTHPVELSDRAKEMVLSGMVQANPIETRVEPPLKGSLQERYQNEMRARR